MTGAADPLRELSAGAALKPRLRGVSHQWAFFVSLVLGAVLVLTAPSGKAMASAAVYAGCVAILFGTSALYHRIDWRTESARRWMRRLDHSAIFLLIAGSYTPFAILVVDGTLADVVLAVVWAGAAAGIVLKLIWIDAPKWLAALIYVLLGWVSIATMPDMAGDLGITATAMVAAGGLLYTVGAVVYAIRRPDPSPTVFGYHEVFHLLVIAASGLQYAVIAFWVLPAS
ncbi:MAG: hemolysin III family protein [Thermoleophilaceae bacterium]